MIARLSSRHRLRFAGVVFVLAGVATSLALWATSGDVADDEVLPERPQLLAGEDRSDAEPKSTPAPEPEPDPEPAPEPVEGLLDLVEVEDLSSTGTGLFQPGSDRDRATAPDAEAVDAFVSAIAEWLDTELTAANRGDRARLPTEDLDGDAQIVELGSPEQPVLEAKYAVTVAALGAPQWGDVRVTVVRADGSSKRVILVVAPGEDAPELLAAEPVPDEESDAEGSGEAT